MRAAFRTLGTLTALLWGFFIGISNSHAAESYYLRGTDSFFTTTVAVCEAYYPLPDSTASSIVLGYIVTGANPYQCSYKYKLQGSDTVWTSGFVGSSPIDLKYCKSGESKTLYFSGGVAIVGGTPYASATAPSNYCIQGCNYNRDSNQLVCSINGDTSNCSFNFVSDAAACNSSPPSSEDEDPTQPPSTGGETGDTGGDTGGTGGDTGGTGGDTGGTGGDTGGGTGGDTGGTGGDTGGTGGDTGGDTGGGDAGETTTAATSGDIGKLGDRVVAAITGLGDRISAQLDGMGFGTAYDGSAEGSVGGAGDIGSAAGEGVGDAIGSAVDGAVAEHEGDVDDALKDVPGQVEDIFGDDPAFESLRGILPGASHCSNYQTSFTVMRYSITLTLPVCLLSSIKPLLEWLVWCLTAIGLWNIFYSGLRLENAKASKGGY